MSRFEDALRAAWHATERSAPRAVVDAIVQSPIPRATVPALLTSRPARFAARELRGGRRLGRHSLRDGNGSFCVHHGSADAAVLAEVFRARHYRMPSRLEQRLQELGRPLRVVDLGAHVGLFGLWVFRHFPTAEIIAFEPDPLNFTALTETIRLNGSRARHWHAIHACAASADGQVAFASGGSSSAHVVPDGSGAEANVIVPACDVFAHLGGVDLLKIDIEGGEWEILGDPRFAEVAPTVLFLEYHPHLCPAADPRTHALSRLHGIGYDVTEVFGTPEGVGLLRATR